MKKWMLAAAVAAAWLLGADARAQAPGTLPAPLPGNGGYIASGTAGGASGGYAAGGYVGGGAGYAAGGYAGGGGALDYHMPGTGQYWARGFFGSPRFSSAQNLTRMPTLPVYMAAPWYLYWPYDGHFQTVAPMAHGLYYPPPTYTGNPYLAGVYAGYTANNPIPAYPVTPVKP